MDDSKLNSGASVLFQVVQIYRECREEVFYRRRQSEQDRVVYREGRREGKRKREKERVFGLCRKTGKKKKKSRPVKLRERG